MQIIMNMRYLVRLLDKSIKSRAKKKHIVRLQLNEKKSKDIQTKLMS